jgi:hypothetical protein
VSEQQARQAEQAGPARPIARSRRTRSRVRSSLPVWHTFPGARRDFPSDERAGTWSGEPGPADVPSTRPGSTPVSSSSTSQQASHQGRTVTDTYSGPVPRQLRRISQGPADPARPDLPRVTAPVRRVRHQVRDGVAVVAFSAGASTAIAVLLVLVRLAG